MNLCCEIFVSGKQFATDGEAVSLTRRLGSRLATLQREGFLAGYQVVTLIEPNDVDDQDLDRELVESRTRGRLPAIYVNLTHHSESPRVCDGELESLLQQGSMELALTYPAQADGADLTIP